MIRSDTESAGRYSRTEVDGSREERKSRISLSNLFKRNKDKVSGADTDTMRTVVTVDDEKVNKLFSNNLSVALHSFQSNIIYPPRLIVNALTVSKNFLFPLNKGCVSIYCRKKLYVFLLIFAYLNLIVSTNQAILYFNSSYR